MTSTGKVGRLSRVALFVLLAPGVLAGSQAVSLPADAAPSAVRPAVLAASAAPRLPAAATRVGAMDATQQVRLTVSLKVRDQAGLRALLAGLADPKSPYYHHYLSKGQFGPRFGPTRAQVAAVKAALRAAGLSPGPVSADRLRIPVTTTAAQVQHAFGTILVNYRLPGGRVAFANATAPKIDASVALLVNGISGLNDVYLPKPASLHRARPAGQAPWTRRPGIARALTTAATSGPTACDAAENVDALTMNVWANYYGMTPLYDLGDLGQGQRIALLELEPNLPSDISAFESCYGISTPVNYIPVDGGLPSGPGPSGEAALDIDILAGLAPQATIDVYQAPDRVTDIDDIMGRFVGDDTDKTLSISWALCELDTPRLDLSDQANLAMEAAAQGQTILAATGDVGSSGCGPIQPDALTVDSPALAPYVVSVGGTTLATFTGDLEQVWNDPTSGATGGGVSGDTCMPAYQYQPLIPGMFDGVNSKTSSLCQTPETPQGFVREVPDVSANADPRSGYGIYHDGNWIGLVGGTSAATPLWAAIAALTNASPYCAAYASGNPGVLPMALYAMTAANQAGIYGGTEPRILRDIKMGNNDWQRASSHSGLYAATGGYDLASGLGAPVVSGIGPHGTPDNTFPGFAAAMCRQMATQSRSSHVTGVSPSSGIAGQSVAVTITGTGFLPVPDADEVRITSGTAAGTTVLATIPASCSSSTTCTATLPAEPGGTTVDVRVGVLNTGFSVGFPVDNDRFTYVQPAPQVSAVSPAHGTASGGTAVTITGTGLAGAQHVTFGGRPGTNLTLTSDTSLTVTAPAGTEGNSAPVVVTGPGGTSNSGSYLWADTPHITSVSPAKGTHNGGTKVTIKGRNFAGVKKVTFGGKAATHLAVSGTGTLTVTAPKGTKGAKVKVTITAAGGTSNTVLYLYT
jgi:subtilase family serine protease